METPFEPVLVGVVTAFEKKLEFMLAAINKLISFWALKKEASIQIAKGGKKARFISYFACSGYENTRFFSILIESTNEIIQSQSAIMP